MSSLKFLLCLVVLWVISVVTFAQEAKLVFSIEGKGEFTMTLNSKAAPKTCSHVLRLAENGFYNGLKFHRVSKKPKPFLVQVGDPETKNADLDENNPYRGGSGAKVPFEQNDLANDLGAVGLASDAEKNISGDSQFYILLAPAKFLNGKYTVFAQITSGMDVVQKIDRGDKISQVKIIKG
jgi:cyclophilin family peptidyl-prolyl cis-trans isomerase